jgi:hypothetical protein
MKKSYLPELFAKIILQTQVKDSGMCFSLSTMNPSKKVKEGSVMKNVIKVLCGCVFFPGVEIDLDTIQYFFKKLV